MNREDRPRVSGPRHCFANPQGSDSGLGSSSNANVPDRTGHAHPHPSDTPEDRGLYLLTRPERLDLWLQKRETEFELLVEENLRLNAWNAQRDEECRPYFEEQERLDEEAYEEEWRRRSQEEQEDLEGDKGGEKEEDEEGHGIQDDQSPDDDLHKDIIDQDDRHPGDDEVEDLEEEPDTPDILPTHTPDAQNQLQAARRRGTGVWTNYEWVDKVEDNRRVEREKSAITSGTRSGRRYRTDFDEEA